MDCQYRTWWFKNVFQKCSKFTEPNKSEPICQKLRKTTYKESELENSIKFAFQIWSLKAE